jgi:pimeloyl-ACP methyl ester carboxylesterase
MQEMRAILLCLISATLAGCASTHSAALSMDAGDFSFVHELEKPKPQIARAAHAVPQENKDRTHLFFINGLDPYYLANFRGQCQYMKSLGYQNSYCGQLSHVDLFRRQIVQIRKNDPDARVGLVGYSLGANAARTLAHRLHEDGVAVDLLVYLGADFVVNSQASRPPNVKRVLNISGHASILLGYDLFLKNADIDNAVNHRLDSRHFLLPTRAEAIELLVKHVAEMERR